MATLNKVMIIGNVGQEPTVRYTADGAAIANVSLATTSAWKDKNTGEKKEETEWHRVVFYGKLAEIVGQYVKKGGAIYVEGRLKTRKWTDKDGVEKITTEITAEQMQLLGGRDSTTGRDSGQQNAPHQVPQRTARPPAKQAAPAQIDDGDIPF
jgi:single-strand DNA-binding protein